jgi:hypothetical protein
MTSPHEITCPGCGLRMPASERASFDGYYNASAECWSVYTEVLGAEYSNAVLFGQIHQLTVDAYAVQHAGGPHPDKSVDIHLSGLYLVLEQGVHPMSVPKLLQTLAETVDPWPRFIPPADRGSLTIFDVALSGSDEQHSTAVREWARVVWQSWAEHHAAVAGLVARYLTPVGTATLR